MTATATPTATPTLSGDLAFAPKHLDFPPQIVGATSSTSPARSVVLRNPLGIDVNVSAITTSAGFAQSNDCGQVLAAHSSCTIRVTFTPITAGPAMGTLTITDDAANSPQTVTLSGNGVAGVIRISPAVIRFGRQVEGGMSAPHSIVLRNPYKVPLSLGAIVIQGQFFYSAACGTVIAPGGTCTVLVSFTPATTGTLTGSMSLSGGAPANPRKVDLIGVSAGN
jgi:hypothetical protein